MTPSLVEQVRACQAYRVGGRTEAREDRIREVGEFLVGRNATANHVMEAFALSRGTAIGYLDELVRRRSATTWQVNKTRWWSASPAAVWAHRRNTA